MTYLAFKYRSVNLDGFFNVSVAVCKICLSPLNRWFKTLRFTFLYNYLFICKIVIVVTITGFFIVRCSCISFDGLSRQ